MQLNSIRNVGFQRRKIEYTISDPALTRTAFDIRVFGVVAEEFVESGSVIVGFDVVCEIGIEDVFEVGWFDGEDAVREGESEGSGGGG